MKLGFDLQFTLLHPLGRVGALLLNGRLELLLGHADGDERVVGAILALDVQSPRTFHYRIWHNFLEL